MRGRSGAAIVLIALVSSGCGSLEEYGSPVEVFEATFGVKPPPSIKGLQAYGRAFADNSTCYLRFQVPRPQLNGLLGPTFMALTHGEFESRIAGAGIFGPTPAWWLPLAGTPTIFLTSGALHPGFTQGQALVSYDPTSQVVHVYWDGMD
jgi:hypothetical protein